MRRLDRGFRSRRTLPRPVFSYKAPSIPTEKSTKGHWNNIFFTGYRVFQSSYPNMQPTIFQPLAFTLLVVLQASAQVVSHHLVPSTPPPSTSLQTPLSCDFNSGCPNSSNSLTCVVPDGRTSGTCQIACSLVSQESTCPLGTRCGRLPGISIPEDGYCTGVPAFCGGVTGIQCPQGSDCVDDPRDGDNCDPAAGGADCGGICAATNTTLPVDQEEEPYVNKACEINPCPAGYDCLPNGKDLCDPDRGWNVCGRLCFEQRKCGSRGSPPCREGETCAHSPDSSCAGAEDCPGVCKKV